MSQIPRANRSKVKKDIGEFIVTEILLSVSEQKSPVSGGKYKKGLSDDYAKLKGSNKADLELEGDLLDSLTFKNKDGGLEIGIFDKKQTGKADGHNQIHEAHKTLPERRFIPSEKQNFKRNIMNGVKRIINDNTRQGSRERQRSEEQFTVDTSPDIGFDFSEILGRDLIDELF